MTYTYDLTTDRGKVRRWINDTDTASGKFTDAEIDYALTEGTTVGGAVIICLKWLLAMLADPNFTADWLTVDHASAYKSTSDLLVRASQEFGAPLISATANHTYRPDSRQDEAPDFSEVQAGEDDDNAIGYLVIY